MNCIGWSSPNTAAKVRKLRNPFINLYLNPKPSSGLSAGAAELEGQISINPNQSLGHWIGDQPDLWAGALEICMGVTVWAETR